MTVVVEQSPETGLAACIFDVDGVLLASPHERAWREALEGVADPERFTTRLYLAEVAGKPRLAGALAALKALGVAEPETKVAAYAVRKQARLEALMREGAVAPFPDALGFVQAVLDAGLKLAVASSSRNANQMMMDLRLPSGRRLLDAFGANTCGRDLKKGKPDPEIFLLAAAELNVAPALCLVVEDSPAGIVAGKAGGMATLGVARLGNVEALGIAGADLVVTGLDEVAVDGLAAGRLRARPT